MHRRVVCLGSCGEGRKPWEEEECKGERECEKGEWLTGRWSVCSHSCGEGRQYRRVECVSKDGHRVTMENCQGKRKPKEERRCRIQKCSAEWFVSEWSKV